MASTRTRTSCIPAASAFLAALAAAALAACGDGKGGPATHSAYLESRPLQTVGGTVKLGVIKPCGADVKHVARVRNQSKAPLEILAYSSNCGCLTAVFKGDRLLQPGDEREVELTVHPKGHGDRSVAVEFGAKEGFAGTIRIDFSLSDGVFASPARQDVLPGAKDEPVDVTVIAGDSRPVKVVAIDPPVGTVDPPTGGQCHVSLSTFEALAFARSEAGAKHPGVVLRAPGKPQSLTVNIITDHPGCPTATFDFTFPE